MAFQPDGQSVPAYARPEGTAAAQRAVRARFHCSHLVRRPGLRGGNYLLDCPPLPVISVGAISAVHLGFEHLAQWVGRDHVDDVHPGQFKLALQPPDFVEKSLGRWGR